jgi:hypothetical protein
MFSTVAGSRDAHPPLGVYPLLFRILQAVAATAHSPVEPELMVLITLFVVLGLATTQSTLNWMTQSPQDCKAEIQDFHTIRYTYIGA